jgi:hypothetical protein
MEHPGVPQEFSAFHIFVLSAAGRYSVHRPVVENSPWGPMININVLVTLYEKMTDRDRDELLSLYENVLRLGPPDPTADALLHRFRRDKNQRDESARLTAEQKMPIIPAAELMPEHLKRLRFLRWAVLNGRISDA